MENNYWEFFRKNWKWKSIYDRNDNFREEPLLIALEDMETDHIIRCMMHPIAHNYTPNTSNMVVFLTELLYRNEQDGK